MSGAVITGWGSQLAPTVVPNDEIAARLDTTDEWISSRTGIHERRVGGTTAGLAAGAGHDALRRAAIPPASIDTLILATTTPDAQVPATACEVQAQLGTGGAAFDLNAACAGFVHALVVAFGLVAAGQRRILVIGAETLSRIVDPDDRSTAVLFGDGAGAVVVEAAPGPSALLSHDLGNDAGARHLLTSPVGGPIAMDGREVFRHAVHTTVAAANRAIASAGLDPTEIDLVVPHQANLRIIDAAAERVAIDRDRWVTTVEHTGNTSAASIPLALAHAAASGRLSSGDTVLLVGFGAGMSWGAAVVRWGAESEVSR